MKGINDPADPNVRHRTRTAAAAMKNISEAMEHITEGVGKEWDENPILRDAAARDFKEADHRLVLALERVRAIREHMGDPHVPTDD